MQSSCSCASDYQGLELLSPDLHVHLDLAFLALLLARVLGVLDVLGGKVKKGREDGGGCRWMRMEWEMRVRDGWVLCWCGGGFIHLFPLLVEWLGLVERWNLPPFLSAEEHMGCSPLLHFFPLCLPCSPS